MAAKGRKGLHLPLYVVDAHGAVEKCDVVGVDGVKLEDVVIDEHEGVVNLGHGRARAI